MKESITIIGAGIGGLVTALVFKKNGYPVHIFEGANAIKPVGFGIIMANNAMQVFESLGLHRHVEKAGNRISKMKITDQQLNLLSEIDLKRYEEQYGVANTAIHRGTLQQLLVEALGESHISLSKRLIKIERLTKGFQLQFEDGSTHFASWLIGADGIHSLVRNELFPKSVIRDAQQLCWRGVSEMELPQHDSHAAYEIWGMGKRFGFVKISDKKVYWYALVNQDAKVKELDKIFIDFHPDIQSILQSETQAPVYTSDIIDLETLPYWQQQNVCLIGDAAHATTPNLGQGACQAIEDAYALGKMLVSEQNIQEAFKGYERLRKQKATDIVKSSRAIGKIAHINTHLGVWLRNAIMKKLPASSNHKQLEKVFKLD